MIQHSNDEQVQAIATRNLSLTADTLTADHFQELTFILQDMLNNHVTAIALLKLDVTERQGEGAFSNVTAVQRLNTSGGAAQGPCEKPGTFRSVAYSADYVFLRKSN